MLNLAKVLKSYCTVSVFANTQIVLYFIRLYPNDKVPTFSASIPISSPENALLYLGHDQRQETDGGLGYAQIGEWRDTLLVPPLANITVSHQPS